MYIDVVIRDKQGKVIRRIRKRKCSSYVRQIIDMLHTHMGQIDTTVVDTGGTSRTMSYSTTFAGNNFMCNAGATVTTHGIRAGTGTAAVTINDYALQTPIAEGSGAGQLSHGVTAISAQATVGSSREFTVARSFTNNSGASITVNEVALYVRFIDTLNASYYAMIERSLLTFTVANGASATVTYTISVTA